MDSTVLVTGCAGFIGSHLTDRLLAEGLAVVGVDNFADYYAREQKEANLATARDNDAFRFVEEDLLDLSATPGEAGASALVTLLADCDCAYHLAAQAGVRASWGSSFEVYARTNVLATQQVLEACVTAHVPKVIYASSSSVYGEQDVLPLHEDLRPQPRSPYGVTKLAGEHLCLLYSANHGLDTVSLRFFTVYGPRQRPDMAFHKFIKALREDAPIDLYGDGSQTRDFTYVDDIVEGLVQARNAAAGSVMNLGGGHCVSLAHAVATLGEIAGREPRLHLHPVEAGDVRDTWADVSRAERLIGYRPSTELRAGLERETAWLAAQAGRS